MRYTIIDGPKAFIDDDGNITTFVSVITAMMQEGWRPQGGVSVIHLTGASAVAACGKDTVFTGAHYLSQAMVHDDDKAKIPDIAGTWYIG